MVSRASSPPRDACPEPPSGLPVFTGENGFSILDILVVLGITGVLAAMAVLQIGAVRPGFKGDGAMRTVMAELNFAREQAIAQRRFMEVEFEGANVIRITRREVPDGTTVLREVVFEAGVQFGLPDGIGDTPDGFGNDEAVDFSSAAFMFSTEGTLIDETGSPVNGTVFLVIPGQPSSLRAVTVLGSTGRVRGHRWNGKWMPV